MGYQKRGQTSFLEESQAQVELQLSVALRPLVLEKTPRSPLLGLNLCDEKPAKGSRFHSAPHPVAAVEVIFSVGFGLLSH